LGLTAFHDTIDRLPGNGPLAKNRDGPHSQIHNGGTGSADKGAGIQDEVYLAAEFRIKLRRACSGWEAGPIGTGSGNRTAECFGQRPGNRMSRQTHTNFTRSACKRRWYVFASHENKRYSTGPQSQKLPGIVRNILNQAIHVTKGGQQHQYGFMSRPAFDCKYPPDSLPV